MMSKIYVGSYQEAGDMADREIDELKEEVGKLRDENIDLKDKIDDLEAEVQRVKDAKTEDLMMEDAKK